MGRGRTTVITYAEGVGKLVQFGGSVQPVRIVRGDMWTADRPEDTELAAERISLSVFVACVTFGAKSWLSAETFST